MKKIICLLLTLVLTATLFTACGASAVNKPARLSIVATTFPQYDWTRSILGDLIDDTNLTLLLDNGVDLHSYQPTAEDLIKVSSCDLFLYIGGESDEWVEDALATNANPNRISINLLEELGALAKEEEVVEGMQAEDEEAGEEETEYDEHIWLSLQNAQTLCGVICDALVRLDAENAATYEQNTAQYLEKLKALDEQYISCVESATTKTLLFADRFPFRYLTDDYGLTYYAAFVGCSAETEASFEKIAFLANKVDELQLKSVLTLEGSDGKIAKTVLATSATKPETILTMNSMQSTTAADVANGKTYLTIMEQNLQALTQALH